MSYKIIFGEYQLFSTTPIHKTKMRFEKEKKVKSKSAVLCCDELKIH